MHGHTLGPGRVVCVLAILGLGLLMTGGCALQTGCTGQQELRVRALVIEDAEGRQRAALQVADGVPLLLFYDEEGQQRLAVGLVAGGSAWGLVGNHADGTDAFGLGAGEDGGCGMALHDAQGVSRLGLGTSADGANVGFHVADGSGQEVLGGGAGPDGTGVHMNDANGITRLDVWVPVSGQPELRVSDEGAAEIWRAP